MSRKRSTNNRLTRRDFLRLGAVSGASLSASWLLAACGAQEVAEATATLAPAATSAPTMAPTEAPAVDIAQLDHITYNPNWANTVLNELADHFGWLEEVGIHGQEITIVDQTQIFPALIGGAAMTGQQDTDALAGATALGEELRFIACFRDKEPWIFGVAPGIETVEDLAGKPVSGGAIGSRNYNNGREMMRRLGMDPDEAEWVPVAGGSDSRVAAMGEEIIYGTVMFDRHRALVEEMGGKILYDSLEDVPQDNFCVHQSWLQDNEEAVIGFLMATTKARQFFHDLSNKDEIIEIMKGRGYEFPPSFIEEYDRAVAINSPTGQFNIDAMEKLIQDSVDTGNLEEVVDWRTFTRMDYLNEAYRRLGQEDMVQDYS